MERRSGWGRGRSVALAWVTLGAGCVGGPRGGTPGDAGADTPVGDADGADGDAFAPPDVPVPPEGLLGDCAAATGTVHLYLNLGDSIGAGYNATGQRGYARLLAEENLPSLYSGVEFRDQAESGWTSDDVRSRIEGTIASLPEGGDGACTLVTLHAGGNDLNDSLRRITERAQTEAAADNLEENYDAIFAALKARYEDSSRGRTLLVLATVVHDPTDGLGSIPPGYDEGFCEALSNPLLQYVKDTALGNLAYFNDRMRAVIVANGGWVVDSHALMLGHAMNATGSDKWMADDCAHLNDEGHHQYRLAMWGAVD